MSIASVSQATAELARLISEGASADKIACARERRAVAEQEQERLDTQRLLDRIFVRAGMYRGRLTLSVDETKLLAAELRRLKGAAS